MEWAREVGGWLLVIISLILFAVVHDYCEQRLYFGAGIMAVIGIFLFRGGIHLLKVAVAARICRKTRESQAAPGR